MLGTAPSGSVQLQDYCVRPEKIGEPFFQSLSAFASDPRRRANAPVNTYSALSSRWRGLSVSDVRTCPTPYALDALAQPSNRILAPQRSWDGLMTGRNLSPHSQALDALAQPSNRILAPQRSWDGLMTGRNLSPHSQSSWAGPTEAAVTASRFSHGSSAACQALSQIFKDR